MDWARLRQHRGGKSWARTQAPGETRTDCDKIERTDALSAAPRGSDDGLIILLRSYCDCDYYSYYYYYCYYYYGNSLHLCDGGIISYTDPMGWELIGELAEFIMACSWVVHPPYTNYMGNTSG